MIGNDTIYLTLDHDWWDSAALALTIYHPTRPAPPQDPRSHRLDTNTPGYRLAATVTNLRCAINLAKASLKIGRPDLALEALESV